MELPCNYHMRALALISMILLAGCAGMTPVDHMPIKEEMYVEIGGIDQWITIKGDDRSNPAILFLHGGPGDAASPFADSYYPGWEKDFTLVQWDQRGAGRTFVKTGESVAPTMTVERMTEDGIEVAEYLKKHLHKKKIILMGGSWGSILGIGMAHARPDLFYAYLGYSQATNFPQDFVASYAKVRAIAQSKNDSAALATLDALGPPPWDSMQKWGSYFGILGPYQAEIAPSPFPKYALASEYEPDLQEGGPWRKADAFTQRLYFEGRMGYADLTKTADFKIPIFIFHGEADLTIPIERVRAYFKTIRAPRKEFYAVAGTGHNPSAAEIDEQRDVLLTEVRPLAVGN